MVALDNTVMDERILKYASFLAETIRPEVVYFIHAIDFDEFPKKFREEFPELQKPADEVLKQQLKDKASKFFKTPENVDVKFEVREGKPLEVIDKWSEAKNVDLLVVGHKQEKGGSGITSQHLTRKIKCCVLFVPDNEMLYQLKVIQIPSDFSEFSKLSVKKGIEIALKSKDKCSIAIQHIYSVPDQYYKTGKSYEEFRQLMEENAKVDYKKFLQDIDTKGIEITSSFRDEKGHHEVQIIYNLAKYLQADLIIIGAKGKSGTASFLLGNITESLMKKYIEMPLLVVKDKSRKFGLMDLLKSI